MQLTRLHDSVFRVQWLSGKALKIKRSLVQVLSESLCCVFGQDTLSSMLSTCSGFPPKTVPTWLKNVWLGHKAFNETNIPRPLTQWITHLTADPEVTSSIPARSHTFMEIDHEIILKSFSSFRWFKKGKFMHKVLVKCLVKLAQEKVWLDELTISTWP